MENIEEKNSIIAKYMGGKIASNWEGSFDPMYVFEVKPDSDTYNSWSNHRYQVSEMKYHNNLNWLWPVLEKIALENNNSIGNLISQLGRIDSKEDLFEAVVNFIKNKENGKQDL